MRVCQLRVNGKGRSNCIEAVRGSYNGWGVRATSCEVHYNTQTWPDSIKNGSKRARIKYMSVWDIKLPMLLASAELNGTLGNKHTMHQVYPQHGEQQFVAVFKYGR